MSSIRQRTKNLIFAGATGVLVSAIVFSSLGLYGYNKLIKHQDIVLLEYKEKLSEAEKFKNEQLKQKQKVVMATLDIKAGEILTEDMFRLGELPIDSVPDNIITDINEVVGKVTKIDISQNGAVIPTMLYEAGITPRDLRAAEYTIISLPTKLKKDDYIDVRISFPTGEDYTVLGKKKVQDLSIGTVWLDVNEQEILTMSSAIIDAYLNDGEIYSLVYKDPEMQQEPYINYPVNINVLDLMLNDPNLIQSAKHKLSRSARSSLERNIKEMTAEERQKIVNGRGAKDSQSKQIENDNITSSHTEQQSSLPANNETTIPAITNDEAREQSPADSPSALLPPQTTSPVTSDETESKGQKEAEIYKESISGAIQP